MSGFMGEAFGAVRGMLGSGGAETASGMLGSALQSAGGVQGLVARADQAGLGDKVRSWVGSGENWPISPAEVERIFPPDEIDRFAQSHGVPAGVVPQVLSELLPHAVDHVTPDGDAAAADLGQGQGAGVAQGDASSAGTVGAATGGFDFGALAGRLFGGR